MHGVTIRNRSDGVTELAPKLGPPLDGEQRGLVVATVLITGAVFFVSGAIPVAVLGAVFASCLAGEVVLATKALVLAVRRPPAPVHEVARWRVRRGAR